jgi:hypothetical protein
MNKSLLTAIALKGAVRAETTDSILANKKQQTAYSAGSESRHVGDWDFAWNRVEGLGNPPV